MIVALAGGIGAAKLLLGLSELVSPEALTVIGNTGDDLECFGLRICPDLDTIAYTLSGRVNQATGWGVDGDTFNCLETLRELGQPAWFQLGDRDLALHLWRSHLLREGVSLSEVTARVCRKLAVPCRLLPMTDSFVPTWIHCAEGEFHLQEYLIRERCRPQIQRIEHRAVERARPGPQVVEAILQAKLVIVCPSNPFISIGPILAVPGIRRALRETRARVAGVSPIVGERALKGPTDIMLRHSGYSVSALSIAHLYQDFLDVLVIDKRDGKLSAAIQELGVEAVVSNTVMTSIAEKKALAGILLGLVQK